MENIQKFISQHLSVPVHDIELTKLFGQASARQYFRITLKQGTLEGSYVVMLMPHGFSSPADEITKTDTKAPTELPFLNVQGYLKENGVPVPSLVAVDRAQGLILLEDLGDKSLEKLVEKADGDFLLFYYKKVIETLIELQTKTLKNPSTGCVAYFRRFDADLLNWEFDHFLEYGIEDRKQIKLAESARSTYTELTRALTAHITAMPYGFVHRDFQSRNIFFKNYHFYLIDFQDALVGPVLYDLVALLRDSYITITPLQLTLLLSHYAEHLPREHPYYKNNNLTRDFHRLTVQRKLKDAGRFQYIATVKNNPNFLKHIPQSLEYVEHALASLQDDPAQRLARFLALC